MIDYKEIITVEKGKRSGQPCIRGMRITVGDILRLKNPFRKANTKH